MHAHPTEHPLDDTSAPPHAHGDHPSSPVRQEQAAYDRHEGHSVAMFRDRFWLSLLLTIPVVIWSHDL